MPLRFRERFAASRDRVPFKAFGGVLGLLALLLMADAWWRGDATLLLPIAFASLTSLVGGALGGFLFGIPRGGLSAPGDTIPQQQELAKGDASIAAPMQRYSPSTRLERVSDWLPKVLIGAGLVQYRSFFGWLSRVADAIVGGDGIDASRAKIVVIASIAVSFIVGFLAVFLWTRIAYGAIQTFADRDILAALRPALESLAGRITSHDAALKKTSSLAQLIARGDLLTAETSAPSRRHDWADEIREKIEKFLAAPPEWDPDPVAELFPDAPSESAGRRLEASIEVELDDYLIIALRVVRFDGEPLDGVVVFLLHPSVPQRIQHAVVSDDEAQAMTYAEGWFTAAAIVDGGRTILTYDLREMPNAPAWFKEDGDGDSTLVPSS